MNVSCCPANDASPKSSAVADERTETNTGSLAERRIAKAPGESFNSPRLLFA